MIGTPGKLRKRIGILNSDITRIDFKDVLYPQKVKQVIEIENPSKDKVELGILGTPEYISVKIDHKTLKAGKRGKITVAFNTKKKEKYGSSNDHVRINIKSGQKNISGTLTVLANMVEDFSKLSQKELENAPVIYISNKHVNLGEFELNEAKNAEFLFQNTGKTDLIIHNIEISNNLYKLQHYDPIVKPGETGKIIITVKPLKESNNLKSNLTVISNDPKNSSIRLLVQGSIKNNATFLTKNANVLAISEKEVVGLMEKYKDKVELVVIDLRTETEFKQGHLPGAINIDFNKEFKSKLELLDREKFYVLYSNYREVSNKAAMKMSELDFKTSRFLENGINGWKKYGFSIEK